MSSFRCAHPVSVLLVFLLGVAGHLASPAEILVTSQLCAQESKVDFASQIKPIFEKHCLRCHGPDDQDGGFRIDDREAVFNYVEPFDASFSELHDYITSEDDSDMMPPPGDGGPLPANEIQLVTRWINQGAEWPESVKLVLNKEVVKEVEKAVVEQDKAKNVTASNLELSEQIVGLLHPLALHFPVALLMGGALFALFGLRGESPLADAAYYCLWLGAWGSIFACVSGWFFAVEKNMSQWQVWPPEKLVESTIDMHRWGGILVATLAFMLALIAASSRRRDPYGAGLVWKFGMMGLAVVTGFVAHQGGKMTHDGLHEKLFNKTEQLIQNLSDKQPTVAPATSEKTGIVESPSDPDQVNEKPPAEVTEQAPPQRPAADLKVQPERKQETEKPQASGDTKSSKKSPKADGSVNSDEKEKLGASGAGPATADPSEAKQEGGTQQTEKQDEGEDG